MSCNPDDLFETLENLEIKLSRTKSWGGLEAKPSYGPAAVSDDYANQIGDPGSYPYTRGAYPKMYRSRMWKLRNIVGYGAPEDTREGLEKVLASGGTGRTEEHTYELQSLMSISYAVFCL